MCACGLADHAAGLNMLMPDTVGGGISGGRPLGTTLAISSGAVDGQIWYIYVGNDDTPTPRCG
jgi:hypothetical protein